MKHVFIINPTAGKVDAAQTLPPQIHAAQQKLGITTEIQVTQHAGHATQLALDAARQGPVRLYACGGDGTLNEVLCGVAGLPGVEVGHIPCGSGNDMIRNYGEAAAFLDLERMLQGEAHTIDLIRVNGRVAASICAAGLDAKVAYNIPVFRRLPFCGGSAAYDLAVLKCLLGKLGCHLRVESDAGSFEGDYLLTAIGNGSYYGGGYHSLPGALTDDGLLNVILVKKIPLLRIPPILKRYKLGTHFTPSGQIAPDLQGMIETFAARKVTVTSEQPFYYTLDGECGMDRTLTTEILPGAAHFILPKGMAFPQKAAPAAATAAAGGAAMPFSATVSG